MIVQPHPTAKFVKELQSWEFPQGTDPVFRSHWNTPLFNDRLSMLKAHNAASFSGLYMEARRDQVFAADAWKMPFRLDAGELRYATLINPQGIHSNDRKPYPTDYHAIPAVVVMQPHMRQIRKLTLEHMGTLFKLRSDTRGKDWQEFGRFDQMLSVNYRYIDNTFIRPILFHDLDRQCAWLTERPYWCERLPKSVTDHVVWSKDRLDKGRYRYVIDGHCTIPLGVIEYIRAYTARSLTMMAAHYIQINHARYTSAMIDAAEDNDACLFNSIMHRMSPGDYVNRFAPLHSAVIPADKVPFFIDAFKQVSFSDPVHEAMRRHPTMEALRVYVEDLQVQLIALIKEHLNLTIG